MRYHVVNEGGEILSTNLSGEELAFFNSCKSENETFIKNKRKFRQGRYISALGTVYTITDDPDIVSRPRYFREITRAHAVLLKSLQGIRKQISQSTVTRGKRLLHNLTELNARNIQEIFDLVPEDELRKTHEQKQLIKKILSSKMDALSKAVLKIIKNNAAIRNEFIVFTRLEESTSSINYQRHGLRRALLNILHIFYDDFSEANIHVKTEETELQLALDYEAFQVSLYPIFDNAVKYALPNSDINISFIETLQNVTIKIDMISMEIRPSEIEKIYQEGFSGFNATKAGKNGQGIGMTVVRKALPLNKGRLIIKSNADSKKSVTLNGIDYVNNIFEITFPK